MLTVRDSLEVVALRRDLSQLGVQYPHVLSDEPQTLYVSGLPGRREPTTQAPSVPLAVEIPSESWNVLREELMDQFRLVGQTQTGAEIFDAVKFELNHPKRRGLGTFVSDTSHIMMYHGSRAVEFTRGMAARTTRTIRIGISGDLSKRKEK